MEKLESITSSTTSASGTSASGKDTLQKYLKYKQKYLQLKNKLFIK
jgi:hypothetical protein